MCRRSLISYLGRNRELMICLVFLAFAPLSALAASPAGGPCDTKPGRESGQDVCAAGLVCTGPFEGLHGKGNCQPSKAAATPVSAKLRLQSDKIPISRTDPAFTELQLDKNPAIYVDVTFTDGSSAGPHAYHNEVAENVVFDDTTGDPNDLIEVVYWDVDPSKPELGKYGAQLTSTGKGVGPATLRVSFRNAPGVSASVQAVVVSGADAASPVTGKQ